MGKKRFSIGTIGEQAITPQSDIFAQMHGEQLADILKQDVVNVRLGGLLMLSMDMEDGSHSIAVVELQAGAVVPPMPLKGDKKLNKAIAKQLSSAVGRSLMDGMNKPTGLHHHGPEDPRDKSEDMDKMMDGMKKRMRA